MNFMPIICWSPSGRCQRTAPCAQRCAQQPTEQAVISGCREVRPLTEADVRRIVREELQRSQP